MDTVLSCFNFQRLKADVVLESFFFLLRLLIASFCRQEEGRIGFEALTTVVTKNTIFWDIAPCSR
jgi:hypothetical protein